MGSRRLGCPLPTPPDSRALRLGTLTNLLVVDLSFFFFCCIKNNTCEDRPCTRTNEKIRIVEYINFGMGNFWKVIKFKWTSVTQTVVWGLWRYLSKWNPQQTCSSRTKNEEQMVLNKPFRNGSWEGKGAINTGRERGKKRGQVHLTDTMRLSRFRLKLGTGIKLNKFKREVCEL